MKRIILVATVLMATNVMAQNRKEEVGTHKSETKQEFRQRKPFTVGEANVEMIKSLRLNDKQAKKVQKLNKKYADIIEPQRPKEIKGDKLGGAMGPGLGFDNRQPGMGRGPQGGMGGAPRAAQNRAPQGVPNSNNKSVNLDAKQEKYDKKLSKILTEEQYAGYLKIRPKFYAQRMNRDFLLGGFAE